MSVEKISIENFDGKNSAKKEKEFHFENNERPKYRYFYHGTFRQSLDKIKERGFIFREYFSNLSLSPMYGFNFIRNELRKGPEQMAKRSKYYKDGTQIDPDEVSVQDAVLLVIEPTEEYKVRATTEGKPNVFSTPDQIPDDVDETIRTRIWHKYQHHLAKEPLARKLSDDVKHPGMRLNKKKLPDGRWIDIDKKDRLNLHGKIPESAIKMIIKKEYPKQEIQAKLERLRSINPDNEVFKRYIDVYTNELEKRLNE